MGTVRSPILSLFPVLNIISIPMVEGSGIARSYSRRVANVESRELSKVFPSMLCQVLQKNVHFV
jgi:hypothetical protein